MIPAMLRFSMRAESSRTAASRLVWLPDHVQAESELLITGLSCLSKPYHSATIPAFSIEVWSPSTQSRIFCVSAAESPRAKTDALSSISTTASGGSSSNNWLRIKGSSNKNPKPTNVMNRMVPNSKRPIWDRPLPVLLRPMPALQP